MPSEHSGRAGQLTAFGLIVIGDEILNGSRSDKHLAFFKSLLGGRGYDLAWHWVLPDDPPILVEHLRFSMSGMNPVIVCGGIGATPDDHTRDCAAKAADVALVRHPEAQDLIEARFGEGAYPTRILMADLPAGCSLVPNPYNRIPGFSLNRHWFLPGFPQMAWPMAEWILDGHYAAAGGELRELVVEVRGVPESRLVPLMQRLTGDLEGVKLFSLPHVGEDPHILLGIRGRVGMDEAFDRLRRELAGEGLAFNVRGN
jgi:molybdopterin-biosynthesis enzyme MoeA-like protein